jgi:hypothetical protein
MRVFSITVPNPYVGEGSQRTDRVAPLGQTTLSYFTVFAKDIEDARQLFVEFCGRNKKLPTGTDIIEIASDQRVSNRVVVDQTPVVYDNVEVSTIDAGKAKDILRSFLKGNDDPLLAEAIRKVVQLDDYEPFTLSTRGEEPEVIEVPIEELMQDQVLADEVSDDINQRLSFFDRLTKKRGE